MKMSYKIIILLIPLFSFYLLLSPAFAGHLHERNVKFTLSQFTDNRQEFFKNYAIRWGCDEDIATTISIMICHPTSLKSRQWAKRCLKTSNMVTYEFITALYIEGLSRHPPVSIKEGLMKRGLFEPGKLSRKTSGFRLNLYTYLELSYPRTLKLPSDYKILTLKGLGEKLSHSETRKLRRMLINDLQENPDLINDVSIYIMTAIKALINQTGDIDFLWFLWNLGPLRAKICCLHLATYANDPGIVQAVLEMTKGINKLEGKEGDRLRMRMIGIFHDQKRVRGVGARLRQIVKSPGQYIKHMQILLQTLGEEGWPRNEDFRNKSTLELFIKNRKVIMERAQNSLENVKSRLNDPVELINKGIE